MNFHAQNSFIKSRKKKYFQWNTLCFIWYLIFLVWIWDQYFISSSRIFLLIGWNWLNSVHILLVMNGIYRASLYMKLKDFISIYPWAFVFIMGLEDKRKWVKGENQSAQPLEIASSCKSNYILQSYFAENIAKVQ